MIAMMSLQDVGAIIEANGFVTVSEPACGTGGMVLATADALQKARIRS
jgi:type I restriction-modification system DNA methylase subunit